MHFSKSISERPLRWLLALALLALVARAHAINWNFLGGPFGGQPLALFNDPAGNTWAGMNGSGVYFRAAGASTWVLRADLPTQSNSQFTIDNAGTVYVSGSAGLYAYRVAAMSWVQLSGSNGLPNQAAGGLATDSAGTLYAAINQFGVFKLAAGQTAWTLAGMGLPAGVLPNHLAVDNAGNVWVSIPGEGVYKLAAGASTWVAVNSGLTEPNVTALIVVGNDVYAGSQFGGLFLLANGASGNSTWILWTGGDMVLQAPIYALAASNSTLYAASDGVVYAAPIGTTQWTRMVAGIETLGPIYALVHSSADGSLTLGNGSGIFVLPAGTATFQPALDGMTAGTTYGIVVAQNGDLYAATFGQGVQRQAAGTSTWTEVDSVNSFPVVGAIAIDNNGTIIATPGGAVKKLVNGSWVTAGAGQNAFAHVLAIDGSNTVWAGVSGGVRKLVAGAPGWTGTGTGLPSNRNVTALAIDGAGTVYAGIYGTGVYWQAAGSATWGLNNAGLDDLTVHVLQRDASGAIHAGTDSGVFKLVAGTWQKLGTGPVLRVYALAFDANGDLYAGTDNDYAWRLAAGTSAWTQVRLGLGSRTVQTFAVGRGRVYAGTDGARGSPSGVFVLSTSDTVIEFYNNILDHYFITASAPEQQAILGGSAGPGWSMTGSVFSAGGNTQVCRFYGSQTPGPNSHFYTIDPAECQQLKNLQASTPPTQKRWNFESNDFAGSVPVSGQCPSTTTSVYRAYNNGFSRGIDSNHRITSDHNAYLQQLARGWAGEGVVMCAPK